MKMFGEEAQQRPVCLPFAKQTWEAIGLLERIQARTDHKTRLRNLAPGGFLSLHQCGPLTLLCLLPELRKHRSCWGLNVYSYFLSIVQLLIPVGAQSTVLSVIHRRAPVCLSLSLRKARDTVTTGARIQLKWEMGKDQNRAEAAGLYSGVEI